MKARTLAGMCSKVPVVREVVTGSVEQVRSGEASEDVNVVMEVCVVVAGEAGGHESGWGRRVVRVRRSEKRRRGRRIFLFTCNHDLILICSSFDCC